MKDMQALKIVGRRARVFAAGVFALLFAAGSLLLLPGCRNVLQPPGTGGNDARPGTLSLTINRQDLGRTILPEIAPDNFVEFRLEFVSVSGDNEDFTTRWTDRFGSVDLDAGVWNLHITAYMYGAAGGAPLAAAEGSLLDIDVPSGGNASGEVALYPIRGGQGTFRWDIAFPESVNYARMALRQLGVTGTPFSTTIHFVGGGFLPENNPGSLTLDSGQYEVSFTLRNEHGESAILSAILRVYRYMESVFEKTFTYEYFPVTLLNFILRSWDGVLGEWVFDDDIAAGHFSIVGIDGIDDDNFDGVVAWFNAFSGEHGPPTNLAGLRVLADAALLGIASEDGGFLGASFADRAYVEAAIAALAENGTALSFEWTGGDTLLVGIGAYEVEFVFDDALALPPLTGTLSVTGIPLVGQTLTANTANLGGRGDIAFQWMRGTDEIAGATASTYTLQAADMGYAISVRVSRDGFTGFVESDPTAVVTAPNMPGGVGLLAQLNWVQTLGESGASYLIEIDGDESLPGTFTFSRPGVTLILRGSVPSSISVDANGSLFVVGTAFTLVLDDNLTLQGRPANNNHLVRVNSGGTLVMNPGSSITGNTNTSTLAANAGGGVRVNSGGTFTMYGGEISGNSSTDNWNFANSGGGVHVESGGVFNMRGGEIFGNDAGWASGGGVFNAGTFRISDGIVRGNEVELEADLRNTAGSGASLFNSGTTEFGIFGAGGFVRAGAIYTLNPTIHVVNGVFQVPQRAGSLAEQLAWLRYFAQSGGEYLIELSEDETIGPQALPTGRSDLTIAISGDWEMRTVSLSTSGSLFTVGSNLSLVLDRNITLGGITSNWNPLVLLDGGTLIMNPGARITGNTNTSTTLASMGGGVRVNSGSTFVMNGGEISGNTSSGLNSTGGGVNVASGGTFTMNGGEISGNASSAWNSDGGGVNVLNGGFFNMRGGAIFDNNAGRNGGGVHVASGGTFRISDGIIHGSVEAGGLRNTATSGAALFNSGTAQFGVFNGNGFVYNGTLRSTNLSVHVINGLLQRTTMDDSLAEHLAWLRDFAQNDGYYIVEITKHENLVPAQTGLPTGRTNLRITLRNSEVDMRAISLDANGSLFTVGSGVTLVLDGNVTMVGRAIGGLITANNNQPLVVVNSGGNLLMNDGVRIQGNTNTSGTAGGVRVNSGGTFTMHGGEISGNATTSGWDGGGVHIVSGGTFNMRGGVIFNNSSSWNGGGVSNSGTFRISDGTIYGNTAAIVSSRNTAVNTGASLQNNGTAQRGTFNAEGVFASLGTLVSSNATIRAVDGVLQMPTEEILIGQFAWLRDFSQSGGDYLVEIVNHEEFSPAQAGLPTGRTNLTITLRNNLAAMRAITLDANGSLFTVGSGVTFVLDGNVTLVGRTIGGLVTVNNNQPLVVVNSGGNLLMNTGVRIQGNTNSNTAAAAMGGAVRVNSAGTFTMHGGEITGNATIGAADGGGVHIANGGMFNMRGGTILNNSSGRNGGGVFNAAGGNFRISDGIIHGNTAAEGTRNMAVTNGAALFNSGTAQRGTFDSTAWLGSLGTLTTTNETLHVENGMLELTGTVEITGAVRVGRILTAYTGDLGGEGAFSFQWLRGGVAVGTNSSTYTVVAADEGQTFTVTVTRAGNFGSVTSAPTEPVVSFAHEENFTISFADFLNIGTDMQMYPPLRIVGSPDQTSRDIVVLDPGQYLDGSISWFFGGAEIDDDRVSGTYGEILSLDSRTHGNMVGTRFVTVEVRCMEGILYSKRIAFTVGL